MSSIWHLLSDTPWWVYVIFIILINVGVKSIKNQVIPLGKLFIMPAVFTAFSLHTLISSVAFNYVNIAVWLGSLLLMAVVGWLQIARYPIKVDRENYLLKLPGTWSTLLIVLLIFAIKYYFGYQLASKPELLGEPAFEMSLLAVTGFCTGYFLGKLSCYIFRFIKEPSVDLSQL